VNIPDYEYTVEQCNVPEVRRGALSEYRAFRRKGLETLRGDSNTSVMNQVHNLTWQTAVFRTLNEARRLEPQRAVNGAMWELTAAGYANLMTLGIRRLVDWDENTDSVPTVIAWVERRPELLSRERYICFDGLPYDFSGTFQPFLTLGATIMKTPNAGPPVTGFSVGTRIPVSGAVSFDFCVKNCGGN
jgi:hypothetical protein